MISKFLVIKCNFLNDYYCKSFMLSDMTRKIYRLYSVEVILSTEAEANYR